jgi:dTDP-glucose 4,6-dehydratase
VSKFLLTGAAGFIGAHVAAELLSAGDEVVGLDNLNHAYDVRLKHWRLERLKGSKGFTFFQGDICDEGDLSQARNYGPFDAVLNLAARAGVRQSIKDPEEFARTNVFGALNVLEFCREEGIKKFVQASTSSLYGASSQRPYREDADINKPLSPYTATKGSSELLCYTYHHLYNLDVTVVRYFTVYGPAGRPDMSIFRFIQWIAEDRPLILYGDGKQERDFTFVEDIARGTTAALIPLGYEAINLGSDHPYSMLELIHLIEEMLENPAEIQQHDSVPADMRATWADIQKAKNLLGWKPKVDLNAGLKSTIEWYLAERAWAKDVPTVDS